MREPSRNLIQRAAVLGHIAVSDPVFVALKLRDRIRKDGTQTLWIADDGCILADDPTAKTAQNAEPGGIVGTYTRATCLDDLAADIEFTKGQVAESALRAMGHYANRRRTA